MRVVKWAMAMMSLVISAPGWGLELPATIDWARRIELSTPVSGIVQEVRGQPGSRVAKGELLYRLDPRRFALAVRAAQARVDRAKPAREEAQREMIRAEDLFERTVLSDHELQIANIALAEADAESRIAHAALEAARLDLEYSAVHAPFAGVILERHINQGQTVVSKLQALPLMILADTSAYIARTLVTEQQLRMIKKKAPMEVRLQDLVFKATPYRHWLEPVEHHEGNPRYRVDVLFHTQSSTMPYPGQKAVLIVP